MRFSLFAVAALASALVNHVAAQSIGNGRLLVQAPDNAVSCAPAEIQWVWTGSSLDAMTHVLSMAVVPIDGYSKRHVNTAANARLIKRRLSQPRSLQSRDVAIRIAGGSNVAMSDQSWTWNSVGVSPGTYRMALTVVGAGLTGYSSSFTVQAGTDMSCLGIGAAPSSTTDIPAPTSTDSAVSSTTDDGGIASTQTSDDSQSSPTSSSANAAITSSSIPVSGDAQQQESTTGNNGHSGKIAAAVVVPLAAIAGIVALFYCRRKRTSRQAASRRQGWSEKAITMLNRTRSQGGAGHGRNISEPLNPIHSAGLTKHDDAVRAEMCEAREGCTLAPSARITSTAGTEHWIDFAGETDACPISPDRMDEIVRVSTEQSRTTGQGLYQQGSNHALRESIVGDRTQSTTSANSSLPAYLRDVASPAPSFGQDADGRPINVPEPQRLSQSSTEMHGLSRDGSVVTRQGSTRDLTRSASKGSVRRKPVPQISVSTTDDSASAIVPDEHDPFADSEAVNPAERASTRVDDAPAIKPHFSLASGRTIDDDRLQEILDGETETLQTPRHSTFVDAPESVHASPAPFSARGSRMESAQLLPGRSLTGPVDVGSSDAGSPMSDAQREAWKLSVRLSDQQGGFRVSFPVERTDE